MLELFMAVLSCCLLGISASKKISRRARTVVYTLSEFAMVVSVAIRLQGDFQNGQTWQGEIYEFLWKMVVCVFGAAMIFRIYRYRRKKERETKN